MVIRAILLAALSTACGSVSLSYAQQPRERPQAAPIARISGVVLSDERPAKRLRRARVILTAADGSTERTVVTFDDGTFAFEGVAPGEYAIRAAKDGYVAMNWGATRPTRSGTIIDVQRGNAKRLTIRLPRGAVITGTIADAEGEPQPGVRVDIMERRFRRYSGQRDLTSSRPPVTTDDRGMYRVFDLAAGEYVVAARPSPMLPQLTEVEVVSAQEVRRALAEVQDMRLQAQPGPPRRAPLSSAAEPRATLGFAPVFYPGTTVSAHASPVTVRAGEERTGVDFDVRYVPAARVSGTVAMPFGAQGTFVSLFDQEENIEVHPMTKRPVDAQGRFTLTGVTPGRYTLVAVGTADPRKPEMPDLWAVAQVVVDGQDVTDLAMALQPPLTLTGRLAFVGGTAPPLLNSTRIDLPLTWSAGGEVRLPFSQVDVDGRFTIDGLLPGTYRWERSDGVRAPIRGWWLKSVIVEGRELLDAPIRFEHHSTDAVVTFSDRAGEVSGVVADGRGAPLPRQTVVLFATNKKWWFFNSRRIAADRTDGRGRFSIRNLPAGEYFAIATDDVEQMEWFDPMLLDELTRAAIRVTLRGDEQKTLNLVAKPSGRAR
jgi:hypothetical protein